MTASPEKKTPSQAITIVVADESPAIRNVFHAFSAAELMVRSVARDRPELVQALNAAARVDAVLCDAHLSGPYGGVRLLTDMRSSRLLAHDTAFILMMDDARKSNLMVGIEARPDSILLKPFKPATLMQKLQATVRERQALATLRQLADHEDWEQLLRLATLTLASGTPYVTSVSRLKAEALAQLGRHDAVAAMYRNLLAADPNSTCGLEGMAQHLYRHGNLDDAERTLARLVVLHPANLGAYDLLAAIQLEKGDPVAAQRHLQQAVEHSPYSRQRLRDLGHVALLNVDTVTAQRAYLAATRQPGSAGRDEADVVNAVRSLVLHGDFAAAWRLVNDARKEMPASLAFEILEHFVEAVLHREYDTYGRTQQRITGGIELLQKTIMPQEGELMLAATEASLISTLPHWAFRLSHELLHNKLHIKLAPAQKNWAKKLHKWAKDVQNEPMPNGLQHYQKFMQ